MLLMRYSNYGWRMISAFRVCNSFCSPFMCRVLSTIVCASEHLVVYFVGSHSQLTTHSTSTQLTKRLENLERGYVYGWGTWYVHLDHLQGQPPHFFSRFEKGTYIYLRQFLKKSDAGNLCTCGLGSLDRSRDRNRCEPLLFRSKVQKACIRNSLRNFER